MSTAWMENIIQCILGREDKKTKDCCVMTAAEWCPEKEQILQNIRASTNLCRIIFWKLSYSEEFIEYCVKNICLGYGTALDPLAQEKKCLKTKGMILLKVAIQTLSTFFQPFCPKDSKSMACQNGLKVSNFLSP